jgi:hypothetical protein
MFAADGRWLVLPGSCRSGHGLCCPLTGVAASGRVTDDAMPVTVALTIAVLRRRASTRYIDRWPFADGHRRRSPRVDRGGLGS